MDMPTRFFFLWALLSLSNFLWALFFSHDTSRTPLEITVERSFFQGVALVALFLSLPF